MADTFSVTCPNCKNVYPSNASMKFCICGAKLVSSFSMKDLKDLFGKDSPFSMDMFQGRKNGL